MQSPCFFVGHPTLWLQLQAENQTPTLTLWLIVWHNDCVLKDDLREILNSSNKRCTVMYKQSFSCKINCTEVKWTATKLHACPDKPVRVWSRILVQKWGYGSHSDFGQNRTPGSPTSQRWLVMYHTCVCSCDVAAAIGRDRKTVTFLDDYTQHVSHLMSLQLTN